MSAPFDPASLNPEQLEAVNWPGGPLMVFAGAGSGKTRVITCRIARIVAEGTRGSRILAVTFTNKAANEMRERIEGMVGIEARYMWLGTFHSICARLLRMEGAAIGLDTNFTIYDDADQIGLVKEILKALDLEEKSIQPRSVLAHISRAKERLMSPAVYRREAAGYIEERVADIYDAYNRRLDAARAMDFDDILLNAVRLLEQSETVREKIQERFLHVLVDEYQDVNLAQYKFADLVSRKHRNITIVGDDDQSIYAWRGADVSLMLRFGTDHPDAKVVTLSQNYRSTPQILEAAHAIIRHNRTRAEKQLWTENAAGAPITLSEAGTEHDEAMMVADRIVQEVRAGRRRYSDFAVLYRTNAQSRVVEEAFLTMRLPHILVGGQRFYERKEIRDMVAYLRLILNPRDDVSFRRVINVPARSVGTTTLKALTALAERKGIDLWEAVRDTDFQHALGKKTLYGIKHFVGLIEEGRRIAARGSVTDVLRHLLDRSGYIEELKLQHTEDSQSRLENLQEFLGVTMEFDEDRGARPPDVIEEPAVTAVDDMPARHLFDVPEPMPVVEGRSALSEFLEQVALQSDVDTLRNDGDAATLMTLHSAKGLEFPVVFLLGLEEGVFPHSRSLGEEAELEEERRLCYVGMTRAREELHLVYSRRRHLFGQPSFNRQSRFVDDVAHLATESLTPTSRPFGSPELRTVRPERTGTYTVVEPVKPLRKPEWTAPFGVGQQVKHPKFGIGVVISCGPLKGDAEVTVAFPGMIGIKKLVQSLAKLEAV